MSDFFILRETPQIMFVPNKRSCRHLRGWRKNRQPQFESLEARRVLAAELHNVLNPVDVNQDHHLTPIDALLVINHLNMYQRNAPPGAGAEFATTQQKGYLVDVNGDDLVTPLDALLVIQQLNRSHLGLSHQGSSSEFQAGDSLYVSTTKHGKVGGLQFQREDILAFDLNTQDWGLAFDGSDVGLGSADINAFHFLSETEILLSIDRAGSLDLPGLGRTKISQSDIYKFTSASLGPNTSGSFSLYFDGSDVGMGPATEAIDALAVLPDGSLILSTSGKFSLENGSVSGDAQDLIRFIPDQLGEDTAGRWEIYFDGSDVGISKNTEDLWGVAVDSDSNDLFLTTRKQFDVGLRGDGLDILRFSPTTLGPETAGLYASKLFFDGSAAGLTADSLDGIHLMVSGDRGNAQLDPIDDQSIGEGHELSLTATVSGGSSAGVSLSLRASAPAGATIDPISGLFTWTPNEVQGPGSYLIEVLLEGTQGVIDSESFQVTVGEVNQPPLLSPIGNLEIETNSRLIYQAVATDADRPLNELTFSLDAGAPAGLTIDATTGELTWLPTSPGTQEVTIRVTDNGQPPLDDSETITMTSYGCPFDVSLWNSYETGGSENGGGSLAGGSCAATLREGDSFQVAVERTLIVPDSRTVIELTLENLNFDATDLDSIKDALEVAVVDGDGKSLVHRVDIQGEVAFNFTEGLTPQTGAGSQFDGSKLSIDLSGVPAGTEATVVIQLINNDDDTLTSIGLKRFEILPGAGQGNYSTVLNDSERPREASFDLEALVDVTPSLALVFGSTSFNQATSKLDAAVSLRNVGQNSFQSPIVIVMDGISDPSIRPVGFDGRTPDGRPYYVFDVESADGRLEPTASTFERNIRFGKCSRENSLIFGTRFWLA